LRCTNIHRNYEQMNWVLNRFIVETEAWNKLQITNDSKYWWLYVAHWTETENKRSFIFFLQMEHSADIFFSVGNQFFLYNLYNFIQLPIANIFYFWCTTKQKIVFFAKWHSASADGCENDVWHENYKWHHMALDFSTDWVKLGPKLT
jgi:hypothetical protein